MPKIYKRRCNFCRERYEGYGEKYCSEECAQAAQRQESETEIKFEDVPPEGERIVQESSDDKAKTYAVTARYPDAPKTLEELIEAVEVDTDVWEVDPNGWEAKSYNGFYKDENKQKAVVVPMFSVRARFVKKTEARFDIQPTVLDISRPKVKTKKSDTVYVSVHHGDEHFPYHDPRAINILMQIIDEIDPDLTVAHGDVCDCTQISEYEKDPHNRISLDKEIQWCAEYLGTIDSLTREDCEHMFFAGNHEDRIRRQVWKLADQQAAGQLINLPDVKRALEIPKLLGLESMGWEYFPYPQHHVLFDRLILKHGNTVRKHSAYSAKAEYGKYKKSGISGHTHRRGVYETRDHNGFHAWFEIGLLGKIRHDYVDFADWQQGFAVVTWSHDKTEFDVEQVRIHNGVARFRGKRYVGDSNLFGEFAEG